MEISSEFDDIRPYNDDEVASVIQRLFENPRLREYMNNFFPEIEWESFKSQISHIRNVNNLQHKIIKSLVITLVEKNSTGITGAGFENISKDSPHLYISNHRDIILDASILSILLISNGFSTPEIAIGDNLMLSPWIEDVVRLNKSFIVKRGVSGRQMLEVSRQLSCYIHNTITNKKESIWIAQREGRAKDSNDRTQNSLLKMLAMGGDKDFLESIGELNITPVSLSYEYDPCDFLKAKEFQQKRDNPDFKKSRLDDLVNMQTGLFGFKGNICFRIGKPVNPLLEKLDKDLNKNKLAHQISQLIDNEIFLNYQFYPMNYIAYDRLWGKDFFKEKYTSGDEEIFDTYLQKQLEKIDLPEKDIPFLTEKILEMYANPVKNQLSAKQIC
ncbi:MAG: 1-acyl-sn-glycerol-3-phosphate acyltransferase [Dysgonamonadaceae bacterium]|nr:1-acyl-sn-glycerol-3-phosphate acyltransferase [Dysgonamonadaceae bacterium]